MPDFQTAARMLPALPPAAPPLFLELARCLDPEELEAAVLETLRRRHPRRTAVVSLEGGSAEPRRYAAPGQGARPWPAGAPVPALMAVPVQDDGEVVGWIAFIEDRQTGEEERGAMAATLQEVAAAAAVPARNARRHADALSLVFRDPLTALFNRRAFEAFLEKEVLSTDRSGRSLSLILLDLDGFKEVNDRFGHLAGDELLRQAASLLESAVRRSDILARLGGDEFTVLLPETPLGSAVRLAGRLRKALARAAIELPRCGQVLSLRGSFGVCDLARARGDGCRLVDLADQALYRAKRAGGNRVRRARGARLERRRTGSEPA